MPEFDWTAFTLSALSALVPVVTGLFVWAGRLVVAKVPRAFIPIVAVSVGTALDFLIAYINGGAFNPIIGALLGASAVWIREFLNTVAEHGLDA